MKSVLSLLVISLIVSSCALGIKDIPTIEIESKYANPKDGSKFIAIDGTRVHYRDQGNPKGETLLLIHGIVSSLHTWDGWVKELGTKYRIIRFDVPGFGLSGAIKGNKYTKENYVDFLHQFMNKLELKSVHLAGNSLGGFIAWNYSVTYPDRVKKMVLIDPAGYPFDPPWLVKVAAYPAVSTTAAIVSPRFVVKLGLKDIYGSKVSPSDNVIDRYYEIFLKEGNREMCANVFFDLLKYRNHDPKDIKRIKSPTFVMWGGEDTFIPVEQLKLWKRDLPHAYYKMYQGVGHLAMEEVPVLSARDADRFLMN